MSDGIVIYPSELEPDSKHMAQLTEQHRLQEVEGLRRELEQIAAQREQLAATKPVAEMIVVDTRTGKPVPNLRVERVSAGLAAEQLAEQLTELDSQIEAVLQQFEYRNVAREVNAMPKVPGNIKAPKIKGK
jgi:hypothetical protein